MQLDGADHGRADRRDVVVPAFGEQDVLESALVEGIGPPGFSASVMPSL